MKRLLHSGVRYIREYMQNRSVMKQAFVSSDAVCINLHALRMVKPGVFHASQSAPHAVFWIRKPSEELSISIQRSGPKTDACILYYSYTVPRFSPENMLVLPTDGEISFVFSRKVRWVRIDPIKCEGSFALDFRVDTGKMHTGQVIPVDVDCVAYAQDRLKKLFASDAKTVENTIVIVTHELSQTGAPILCRKISESLRKRGLKTIIVSLDKASGMHAMPFLRASDVFLTCQSVTQAESLIAFMQQLGLKKVLLNTVVTGHLAPAFHKAGFTVLSLIHEMHDSIALLQAQAHVRALAEDADCIVFPNEYVQADFCAWGYPVAGACKVCAQGYYKEHMLHRSREQREKLIEALHLEPDAVLIAGVGAINFGKGPDVLVQVIAKLRQRGVNAHALWLGSTNMPPYDVWLRGQIRRMGLADQFHFVGFVQDDDTYMHYLCACDVLALVSREDSMPSSMIEAMSCGLPVVGFRSSGGAEAALQDGRGALVTYMDVDAFCDAIIAIYSDAMQTQSMVEKAQVFVRTNLDFEQYVTFLLEQFVN